MAAALQSLHAMQALLPTPRSAMSRTHAESHRRIKLISAEIDRLLTRLRPLNDDPRRILAEVAGVAQAAREQPELAEWSAFLDAHAHLIARGGAVALLQHAVGLASSSLVTLAADEWALGRGWKVNWFRRTQRPRDWHPGHLLRTFDLEGYRAATFHLLAGGARLLSPAAGGGLRVYNLGDGTIATESGPERRAIEAIAPLPDGTALVAGDDGSLQSWALDPLAQRGRQAGHQGAVLAMDVAPGGRHALTLGADGAMIFWSTDPLRKVATFEPTQRSPRVVALSPSGTYVFAGHASGRVEIWSTAERKVVRALKAHRAPVERIVVDAAQNQLITSASDGTIAFWAMPSGELLRQVQGHRGAASFLWLDATLGLLSGGSDGQLRLWAPGSEAPTWSQPQGDGVTAVSLLPGGKLAVGAADGAVKLLDPKTGAASLVGHHEGPVVALLGVDNNALLTCGLDRAARLWIIDPPASAAHQRAVLGLDAEGQRALCQTTTGELEHFDFAEGRRLRKFPLAEGTRVAASLLENNQLLLDTRRAPLDMFESVQPLPHAHTLRLVDAERGEVLRTLEGHKLGVRAALVDPRGRLLATGSADGEVRLWDLTSGACVHALQAYEAPIVALAFEPEGIELYALYQGNEACTWSTRSGKLLRRIQLQYPPEMPLLHMIAAGEHELIMAGVGGEIGRWDAESGRRTKSWRAHGAEIRALALSPEGDLLASGSDDRQIRLWKRSSGKQLAHYDLPAPAAGCRFLPDGRLAVWSTHGEPHYLKFVDWAQDD